MEPYVAKLDFRIFNDHSFMELSVDAQSRFFSADQHLRSHGCSQSLFGLLERPGSTYPSGKTPVLYSRIINHPEEMLTRVTLQFTICT